MAQKSNRSKQTAPPSDTSTPPPLWNPPSIRYDQVDEKFATSNCSFTAKIIRQYDNPIMNGATIIRKRCRLSILSHIKTDNRTYTLRMSAYLCDGWRDIMHYIWNTSIRAKARENAQISITFFKIPVEQIPSNEIDPVQQKNIAFIIDNSIADDAWLEFKTCCHRICGTNGLRVTKSDVINHLIGTPTLPPLLSPPYPYLPFNELIPNSCALAYLYGYVSFTADAKPCTGGAARHNWYKQIRIRDCTLAWDADDLQVMVFGNDFNAFPNVKDGDLLRLHRIKLNYRQYQNVFQAVLTLDQTKPPPSFIVIDGNLTIANNKEAVKQSSSNNFTFDEVVDGYMVRYLKHACRIRQEHLNPELRNINVNMQNENENVPNVLSVNQIALKLLTEINADDERINVVVMITGRCDIDDTNLNGMEVDGHDIDRLQFYWIIWDGTECDMDKCADLFQLYDMNSEDSDVEWKVENNYTDVKVIGSSVKLLVSPDYETGIMCYNEIKVGCWVEFTNLCVDKVRKELIYDQHSKLCTNIHVKTDARIQRRLDTVYHKICRQTSVVTSVASIHPHHQYQSYSLIKSVLSIKDIHCRYRIRGKCVDYHPQNIQLFTQHKIKNKHVLQFVLCIQDASGGVVNVIFAGREANIFFGIDNVVDLEDVNNQDELDEIGHFMEIVMGKTSIMDVCIRSYKVKNKYLIAYKAFDTVLIK